MKKETVIDESNFSEYFRDCRNSKPEQDDIIAKYSAIAEFVEGTMKRDLIHMLKNFDMAVAATKIMKKLAFATEKDSVRVCREICEDLSNGLSESEIEKKSYSYEMEMFFYTKKEFIPWDDPHWTSIGILNLGEYLDSEGNSVKINSKVVFPEEQKSEELQTNNVQD